MIQEERFGQFFRRQRRGLRLGLREFCRRHNLDPGNISKLERGIHRPPKRRKVLDSYATSLKLAPGTKAYEMFFDLAAAERGQLPPELMERAGTHGQLRKVFRQLREPPRRPWTTTSDLEFWAGSLPSRSTFPHLLRKLILATSRKLDRLDFPVDEGIQRRGWDGIVETSESNLFVPKGRSCWEVSTSQDPDGEAESNFTKRKDNPQGCKPEETVFVFASPRKWDEKRNWSNKKRKEGVWKDVRAYDCEDLVQWLEIAPAVDAWLARHLGIRPSPDYAKTVVRC